MALESYSQLKLYFSGNKLVFKRAHLGYITGEKDSGLHTFEIFSEDEVSLGRRLRTTSRPTELYGSSTSVNSSSSPRLSQLMVQEERKGYSIFIPIQTKKSSSWWRPSRLYQVQPLTPPPVSITQFSVGYFRKRVGSSVRGGLPKGTLDTSFLTSPF
jgi:hypothetical protein